MGYMNTAKALQAPSWFFLCFTHITLVLNGYLSFLESSLPMDVCVHFSAMCTVPKRGVMMPCFA